MKLKKEFEELKERQQKVIDDINEREQKYAKQKELQTNEWRRQHEVRAQQARDIEMQAFIEQQYQESINQNVIDEAVKLIHKYADRYNLAIERGKVFEMNQADYIYNKLIEKGYSKEFISKVFL